jgi:hypothetical protein
MMTLQPTSGPLVGAPAIPSALNERELAQRADCEWALADEEVRARYGGQVVAVLGRQVWGVGDSYPKAWVAAITAGCTSPEDLALVPVPVAVAAP